MAGLGRSWAYALSALLGLMLGYAYHAVLGTRFSYKPSLGLYGLPLLRLVLIRNSSFAVILFLLGISPSAQYIALFMSMLVSGIMIAPANPCIAILGTLPHGSWN
ncbi:hypothetical protein [Vulcanisaeta sp. JCM 16161]|uniref:hypothetical protein n=1 Tax=Vulcanisaeta sp. JCM 16161 TaxID=1295372 RepID=UPI0006CF91B8|nr:hypothetical protein [Vulcanisaeta sp. JCM 16161]